MEKPPFSQKKRSASSQRWLQRQRKDIFVQEAQKKNYRSRSALKLLQIQEKYKFLKPQEKVLDLGCAPGGWCQVVQEILSKKQKKILLHQIVGVDIQKMVPISGVTFLQEDILKIDLLEHLHAMAPSGFHVVLSDIAPASSGMKKLDAARGVALLESVIDVMKRFLKTQGTFVVKIFHGYEGRYFFDMLKKIFGSVHYAKPAASRKDSGEIYLIAEKFLGIAQEDDNNSDFLPEREDIFQ